MHHPTDRMTHTMAFVTPVVDHWLERRIYKKLFKLVSTLLGFYVSFWYVCLLLFFVLFLFCFCFFVVVGLFLFVCFVFFVVVVWFSFFWGGALSCKHEVKCLVCEFSVLIQLQLFDFLIIGNSYF